MIPNYFGTKTGVKIRKNYPVPNFSPLTPAPMSEPVSSLQEPPPAPL